MNFVFVAGILHVSKLIVSRAKLKMASTSSLFCPICGHKYEIGKHRFCAYCGRNMQLKANEGIGSNSALSLAVDAQKGCTKPSKVATTSQASTKTA